MQDLEVTDNSGDKKGKKSERADPSRIREIKTNIQAGMKWLKNGNYNKRETRWEMWKRYNSWLRCDWNVSDSDADTSTEEYHVNLPFANFHTMRPNLIFHNPHINVDAKKPEFARQVNPETGESEVVTDPNGNPVILSDNYEAARLMEIRINHEIEQIKLKDIVKRAIGHADGYYGIGWVKIGYQDSSISSFNNDHDTKTNHWVEIGDPRRICFDWRANHANKLKWVAEQIVMTIGEAEDMGLRVPDNYTGKLPEWYEDKDKQAEESGSHVAGLSDIARHLRMVVFWEYHDLVQKTIDWVLIDGPGDEWFYMAETSVDPFPFEGSCYKPLVLTEDDDDLIGLTSITPVEDQIKAMNRLRTRMIKHVDNYGTGMFYEDGALTPNQKDYYRETPFGYECKINKGYFAKIKLQGTPDMGADVYNVSNVLRGDMQTVLNFTDYQQGGSTQDRKATEAKIIAQAANLRIEDKRDIVSDFVIEIVEALAAQIQFYDDKMEFYNVANEEFDDDFQKVLEDKYGFDPKVPFLGINKDRIQGEFDYSYKLEDMVYQPKEVRAAQLARSVQPIMANEFFLKKFLEKYELDKLFTDMFELNGVELRKYEKGGPAQIPVTLENQMFKQGMEVPEPHQKDDHDEHVLGHSPLRKELESMIAQGEAQIQKLQQGIQMIPQMMAGDPNSQVVLERAQQQIDQIMLQMEPVSKKLRNVKLHVQKHIEMQMAEMNVSGGGGGGMPQQQTGQPAQPEQPPQAQPGGLGTFV